MTNPNLLTTLRALAEQITPGEWRAVGLNGFSVVGAGEKPRNCLICQIDEDRPEERANAEFIALVRNKLPHILWALEQRPTLAAPTTGTGTVLWPTSRKS